jgi:hypothetical protein
MVYAFFLGGLGYLHAMVHQLGVDEVDLDLLARELHEGRLCTG